MYSLMEDTTIKDILKTVESAYQQGDFQGAISTLEKNQIHVTPGLWHYNMGTLYAKLENFPLARYHFLMSDMEGYTNKDLIKNKKIVEEKLDIPKHEKMLSTSDYFIRGSVEATHGIFTMVSLRLFLRRLHPASGARAWQPLASHGRSPGGAYSTAGYVRCTVV